MKVFWAKGMKIRQGLLESRVVHRTCGGQDTTTYEPIPASVKTLKDLRLAFPYGPHIYVLRREPGGESVRAIGEFYEHYEDAWGALNSLLETKIDFARESLEDAEQALWDWQQETPGLLEDVK